MSEYMAQLAEEEKKHHKPNYLLIFGVLAVMTMIEVTVAANMPVVLVLLSLAKIVLVASYYMHLRFANAWFTAIFMSPIPLVLLITVALVVALTPGVEGSASAAGVCSFW